MERAGTLPLRGEVLVIIPAHALMLSEMQRLREMSRLLVDHLETPLARVVKDRIRAEIPGNNILWHDVLGRVSEHLDNMERPPRER